MMGAINTCYVFVSEETERLCLRAYQLAMAGGEASGLAIHQANIDLLNEHIKHMKKDADKLRAAKTIQHLEALSA